MQDARKHQRILCRLPVNLFCDSDMTRLGCRTQDIGLGGMFAIGAQCLSVDDPIRVELAPDSGSRLHLDGRIIRITTDGAGLQFVDNSPATMEVLQALLLPDWDGGRTGLVAEAERRYRRASELGDPLAEIGLAALDERR